MTTFPPKLKVVIDDVTHHTPNTVSLPLSFGLYCFTEDVQETEVEVQVAIDFPGRFLHKLTTQKSIHSLFTIYPTKPFY